MVTEDEMVGWHHRFNGHELGQTPGDGEGQRSLVCCSPWCQEELDMTQQLNSNKNSYQLSKWPCPFATLRTHGFLNVYPFTGMKWWLILAPVCISLTVNEVESLFVNVCSPSCVFLCKAPARALALLRRFLSLTVCRDVCVPVNDPP